MPLKPIATVNRTVLGEVQETAHPNPTPKNAELYRACQQFESLFVLQLWRAMQRTLPNQPKTLNYTEMFDLHFADHLAQNGRFGLAEQLYRQLTGVLPNGGSGDLALTHPNPPSPEASGEGGSQTPLSHSTREGQGVRAENLTPPSPLSASREGADPMRHSERSEESQTLRSAQGDEKRKAERGQGGEVYAPLPLGEEFGGEG